MGQDFHQGIIMLEYLCIVSVFAACLFAGLWIISATDTRWNLCMKKMPYDHGRIINYPVAFYDEEFGIVIDQAEYHPGKTRPWLSVPDGTPCYPYAWYDLPLPRFQHDGLMSKL